MANKPFWLALLCSFAVYLIPIGLPHATISLGGTVALQFLDLTHPGQAISALTVAVLLQVAAFALFFWFWRRPGLVPVVALLACGYAEVAGVPFLYLVALPSQFLIEREMATETGAWPEACTVSEASVMTPRAPRRLPADGWDEVWLSESHDRVSSVSILRMPDCQRTPVALPHPTMQPGGRVDFMIDIAQVVPGGLALVRKDEAAAGRTSWLLLNAAANTLDPVPTPEIRPFTTAYLSDDGSHTAWIVPTPRPGRPVDVLQDRPVDVLHVLPVTGTARDTVLDLSSFGPAKYQVVGLTHASDASDEALIWVNGLQQNKLLATTLDGQQRPAPSLPAGVRSQSHTVLLTAHGAIAWDAAPDDDAPYRLAWALDGGSGLRAIPRGSSIVAATVDPAGRYIAVSTTTTLSIGGIRDSVFVFRAADGQEVFRRFLPMYSRTNVVFLGREYFVYSDFARTYVLRVPI